MEHRKKAAALTYRENFEAPIVSATGMGIIANNIIEGAKENKVPIVYNKELTDLLCNINVGDSIPYELYDVVASIIAYITELDKEK